MNVKISSQAELDAVEAQKRNQLDELRGRFKKLNNMRADLLLRIEDGDDKNARKDLEQVARERKEVEAAIEGAEVLLASLPERRRRARAEEIESEILRLRKLDQSLVELIPGIDEAADNFARAIRKYYDVLETLFEIEPRGFHFAAMDIGALDSLGVALRRHNVWRWLKVGLFTKAETMSDKRERNPTRRQIYALTRNMAEVAKRLRGEENQAADVCSYCFGSIRVAIMSGGREACSKCGREREEMQ